jgi:hypothetical protein
MTCEQCLGLLLTTDLGRLPARATGERDADVQDIPLENHLEGCAACAGVQELLLAGEGALAMSLDGEAPSVNPPQISAGAWAAVRRSRRRRAAILASAALVLASSAFGVQYVLPEARRLLAPPPPVVTKTFRLSCLSSEQAASLLGPYLPTPENPRWQAERFSVTPARHGIRAVAVSAPQSTIDRVPVLLAEFERDPNAACRR